MIPVPENISLAYSWSVRRIWHKCFMECGKYEFYQAKQIKESYGQAESVLNLHERISHTGWWRYPFVVFCNYNLLLLSQHPVQYHDREQRGDDLACQKPDQIAADTVDG